MLFLKSYFLLELFSKIAEVVCRKRFTTACGKIFSTSYQDDTRTQFITAWWSLAQGSVANYRESSRILNAQKLTELWGQVM